MSIELFPCYSFKLKEFLSSKNVKYKLTGLHPQSKMQFFVYVETDEFKDAMLEWNQSK